MQTDTKFFGTVEYDEASSFSFPEGLPGFEEEVRFVPLTQALTGPVVFLQSLSRANLCFLTLPVLTILSDYRLQLSGDDLALLDLPAVAEPRIGEDLLCLAILTLLPGCPGTANLMSPIAVNIRNRKALQVIQAGTVYSHEHVLLDGPC